MIIVNTSHIKDLLLDIEGTETPEVMGLTEDGLGFQPEGEVSYRFTASMAGKDLLVRGKAEFRVKAECARCLEDIHTVFQVPEICLMYEDMPDREVDITGDVREELLLAIPSRFLCSEDCKGLCTGCGANLNSEKCTCSKEKKKKQEEPLEDSPWDVLDQLGKS